MQGLRAKLRVAVLVILTIWIGLLALYGLLKPISNGCVMTYMYPTYVPISTNDGGSSAKYGLYLYHEGRKKIDFNEHLKQLSGVPVLFIPGNGGSYKQASGLFVGCGHGEDWSWMHLCEVRSLAAESDRAYQGGPLERTFYQEAILTSDEGGLDTSVAGFQLPNQYASRLDWFAVDLEGEHSAMDGRILEEHTEYVVYAIHRILDQYKESHDAREREGAATSGSLPKNVILVGHSMGGFVARAAIIHPNIRKSAVETIITLSTPHQSPPVALQPSLGHYFAYVNQEWRNRYEIQKTRTGHYVSDPLLSHVVVISISGGYNDYQVRSKLETLDDIVPYTHGFMISSTGMRNVWLSMEHQAILWCNQLVVQVSHTLLSLVDSRTGLPFPETQKRLTVFSRMLRSGIPQTFNWMRQPHSHAPIKDIKDAFGSQVHALSSCPKNVHWNDDGLERDLYIQTTTMTVLAMDGRRRWLDIQKLGSNGKSHFIFVTNLAPCFGVRLHLWPEKAKSTLDFAASKRVVEVTSKLVQIPSRPAPRQVEPGSQTEQAPPSAILRLSLEDMRGFRFLTISVAPRPSISGRPPPATSMAVGQFFNPEDGERNLSVQSMLLSTYLQKEIFLEEDHPLAFNLSFSISLGLLPVTFSLKTMGCGIKRSGLPAEEAGDIESIRLCKLRCFPPVALAWDPTSGLHIFPNLYGETIVVDSSPATWSSVQGSEKTTVLLLVDPHCSYKISFAVSETAAASRFLLLYSSQVVRVLRVNPVLVTALTAITLGCFVHPALGLFILLSYHALCCHNALCSFLTASFRSHARRKELFDFKDQGNGRTEELASEHESVFNRNSPIEENSMGSPNSSKSFGDTQLEIFHHQQGLLILHLLGALMFVPSLVAWLQRIGLGHSFPWFLDSALCIGVILHGIFNSKPESNSLFAFPAILGKELRLDFVYLLAGYYSYLSGLGLEPYKVFYAMSAIGFISFVLKLLQSREKGEPRFGKKKHSHKQ
ncbi:hypothetical protein JCGZ_20319 [Jatropha curcas]|uniref:GPI inositol-deacylase n=1 Tax=Jatropha curcas TaxID=180498 RepID=A0A067K4B9_JATCU|nr:hypothetical protein JCGZ_20319 [Jatropha curcas]